MLTNSIYTHAKRGAENMAGRQEEQCLGKEDIKVLEGGEVRRHIGKVQVSKAKSVRALHVYTPDDTDEKNMS